MRRTTISSRLKDESGIALVAAIAVLLIGLLLSTAVVVAATGESSLTGRDTAQKRAFEAAQAGLQQTLYDLNTLINTSSGGPTALERQCIDGVTVSGQVQAQVDNPSLNFVPSADLYADCGPYTQRLGNGAFYTTWTSIVLAISGQACTGPNVGVTALLTNRCIVSEGIVCPPSYSTPSCPNPVTERVEERVAANTGKPLFPLQGIIALNGVLIRNSARVFGSVSSNGQIALQQSAQVNNPVTEGVSPGQYPLISNTALLGTGLACNSTNAPLFTSTSTWPATCFTHYTINGINSNIPNLEDDPPPLPQYTDDARITCAENNQCAHDTFSTSSGPCLVNASGCATWNPSTRSLSIPNGVTWTIGGGTYNFCSFNMTGGNSGTQAVLANGVKTEIYIDSPKNPSPSSDPAWPPCPTGSGTMTVSQGAAFVNNSPPLTGSPLAHDTTALFIDVYGNISPIQPDSAATYNFNSCDLNGNTTDSSCVQLGQSSNFYGTVWAPESDVKITNTGSTFGGIAGRTVTFDNPGSFTQDVNDKNLVTTATQALYFRTAWTQCNSQNTNAANPMAGC